MSHSKENNNIRNHCNKLMGFKQGIRCASTELRVLTIIDGLIVTLFEVRFPFRFPSAVGENGKGNGELAGRMGAVCRYTDEREVRLGWRAGSPRGRERSDRSRSAR
jgi:hypothetical protein